MRLTRRSFLSSSAGAASMAATPVAAAALNPDATLLELGRQYTAARAGFEAAMVAADDAADRFEAMKPKQPPQALFARAGDGWRDMPDPVPHPSGAHWYRRPDIIDDLRTQPRMQQDWSNVTEVEMDGEPAVQCGRSPWPEAQARADEVVAAYDAWRAEIEAARRASGHPAAEARLQEASQRHSDLIHQIALHPTSTLAGLMLKARVAAENSTSPENIEVAFEAKREEEGASETMLAMSIVRDLMRLKEEA